jgi:hypothetical protein
MDKAAAIGADVNGDGTADILDLVVVGSQFGCVSPNPAAADVNEDGVAELLDIVLVGASFG